jgi:hypothetical protein
MNNPTVSRFWENYTNKLESYKIKPTVREWYVRHAQHYVAAYPERRLASHTDADLEKYLQDKGRNIDLKDWQFQQIVKALQVLFVEFVKPDWALTFPWQERITVARTLPDSHATVARDYVSRCRLTLVLLLRAPTGTRCRATESLPVSLRSTQRTHEIRPAKSDCASTRSGPSNPICNGWHVLYAFIRSAIQPTSMAVPSPHFWSIW